MPLAYLIHKGLKKTYMEKYKFGELFEGKYFTIYVGGRT